MRLSKTPNSVKTCFRNKVSCESFRVTHFNVPQKPNQLAMKAAESARSSIVSGKRVVN